MAQCSDAADEAVPLSGIVDGARTLARYFAAYFAGGGLAGGGLAGTGHGR